MFCWKRTPAHLDLQQRTLIRKINWIQEKKPHMNKAQICHLGSGNTNIIVLRFSKHEVILGRFQNDTLDRNLDSDSVDFPNCKLYVLHPDKVRRTCRMLNEQIDSFDWKTKYRTEYDVLKSRLHSREAFCKNCTHVEKLLSRVGDKQPGSRS